MFRLAISAGIATLLLGSVAHAQVMPRSETLLPANQTSAYFSVDDVKGFKDALDRSAFGRALNDKALKPFLDDTKSRQQQGLFEARWLVGLTWDEIQEAAGGSFTTAIVTPPDQEPAIVLMLDVKGRTDQARAAIAAAGKRLTEAGHRHTSEDLAGSKALLYEPPAAKGGMHPVVYFLQGDLFIAGTGLIAVKDIVGRLPGGYKEHLGASKAFQATTERAAKEQPGGNFRWFTVPLAFAQDWQRISGQPRKKPDPLKVLKEQGFTALQGCGGTCELGSKSHELLAKAYVYAPPPYQLAMRMLDFPNMAQVDPPAWVPRSVSSFGMMSVNYQKVFDNYATLFDAYYADGDQGVFKDIIRGLLNDPDGPGVDVDRHLVKQLHGPLFVLGDSTDPQKDEWLFAAAVKDSKTVASALAKLLKGEKNVNKLAFGDNGLWQIMPTKNDKKDKRQADNEWALPPSAVAVHQGYLVYAETPNAVRNAFAGRETLSASPEYQRIMKELADLVGPSASVRYFFRLASKVGPHYEQYRAGKLDQGVLDQWMPNFFSQITGQAQTALDVGKLPLFDQLRPLFTGEGGMAMVSQADGWALTLTIPRSVPAKK